MQIDSPSNPRILAAAGLRARRERDRTGLTLVDGARESMRAIEARVTIDVAYVCPSLITTDEARRAVEGVADHAAVVMEVGERAFARVAYGDRADGIVLVVRAPSTDLARIRLPSDQAPFLVVTEALEKPGNLGAILRSADGAGVDAVISADGTDLFNPNVIRASTGIVFSLPIASAPAEDVLAWLRAHEIRVVAARVDADTLHTAADLTGPLAIVLGNEAKGLSTVWQAPGIETVRLPMLGVADSLNVSVAGAVLLYEARRQRDR